MILYFLHKSLDLDGIDKLKRFMLQEQNASYKGKDWLNFELTFIKQKLTVGQKLKRK